MCTTSGLVVLIGLLYVCNAANVQNCTDNKDHPLSCYTCMGRDMENCEHGLSCCSGSCFKLMDTKHNVVVKGCTSADEEDASMKVRTLEVPLYWADGEKVTGESYFCKSTDYCNAASLPTLFASALVVLLSRYIV